MTFSEAAMIMMSGGSPAVIQPIIITENGKYEAPEGTDGYNPINVSVPDRYDEGYQDGYADGYSDASDIYQTIINQQNGDGENVTDDEGNEITNAVVTPSDALENYLTHLIFSSNGGSVTCQGLDADTAFKFEARVIKEILSDVDIRYATGASLTTINLKTGKEYIQYTGRYATVASNPPPPPHRIRIKSCKVATLRVDIIVEWIHGSTGEIINSHVINHKIDTTVNTVGGTAFVGSKNIASTVTQNSEPSEIVDYR